MMDLDGSTLDWARVVSPQRDGHDSRIALQFAAAAGYVRRPVAGCKSILDGRIAIRPLEADTEVEGWCEQGELDSVNLERAATLLQHWPEGFSQFVCLIDTIFPIRAVQISTAAFPSATRAPGSLMLGSASHSEWRRFGSLYTTSHDPIGTAQAFVHELAHQKLRALGVHVDRADRLVINSGEQQFESPVRKDKLRPMTAVVHATYSWFYICQLDCHLVEWALASGGDPEVTLFQRFLARNISLLAAGLETIHAHVEVDDAGAQFFPELLRQGAALIERACRLLDSSIYAG